jgi:hypothetical protein
MARSSTRSSGTKKGTGKKSPSTKKSSSAKKGSSSGSSGGEKSSSRSAPRAEARPARGATEVAAEAARQLLELTGKQAEGVTGLERTDDGWKVHVEVVEVRRIPDTTDVLALYEVETDNRGGLQGYRRVRRYARGVPGED